MSKKKNVKKKNLKDTKKNPNANENVKSRYNVKNAVINYYLILMFTVFPLFFTNQFARIRHDKYFVYLALSGVLIVVETVVLLITLSENNKGNLKEKKWYRQLSVPDYAFGALILIYALSTAFSITPLDAFTGEAGRNNGLLIFLVFFFVYIIISRWYAFKEYVFVFVAGGSLAVYLLSILNFFYIDPLGMYRGYAEATVKDFTATIGNKNIMSAFCCLTIPLLLMLFMNTKNTVFHHIFRYVYLVVGGIGFAAMLCADSESGFLGLVPTMALILLYYSRNITMLRKFFTFVASMLIAAKLLIVFSTVVRGVEKGFGTMQITFIYDYKSLIAIAVTVAIALGLWALERKNSELVIPKAVPAVLIVIYAVGFIGIASLFVKYSFLDTESKLGGIMTFFRFNEKWGTHRGFMWIKAWEIFRTSGVKNLLLGWGPDTFYKAFAPYFAELTEKFNNSSTNCAHNEFLNYLITTGVFGLAAYLTLFVSAIVRAVKTASKNPLSIVFIAPVVCYLFQSVVNIANPIVTPLLFIFLALSEAIVRKERLNK
jgi:hypothetical protein